MENVAQAKSEVRTALAAESADLLEDTCTLIVIPGEEEYEDTPCRISGGGGDIEGAPYRISFAWNSPAVIDAAVVVDAIDGRPQLTLQLVEPVDSSTSLWQEWKATSAPVYGRANVGL